MLGVPRLGRGHAATENTKRNSWSPTRRDAAVPAFWAR